MRELLARSAQPDHNADTDAADVETASETEATENQSHSVETSEAVHGKETDDDSSDQRRRRRRIPGARVLAYAVLPALALFLAMGSGYLKWYTASVSNPLRDSIEAVRAASDSTIAMLSYQPDTVDKNLTAARDRLTGSLKDSFSSLVHDVVIPGSKQKQISAVATVAAAAAVSATETHAVVLEFVNQTDTVGTDPPTYTASRVRVTLDKIGGRWLIAGFDPI